MIGYRCGETLTVFSFYNTVVDWDVLTLIRVACQPTLKEWLVGILIPTDVGLLIPTLQSFGTVKNGKNA